ncbi:MAG TPA: glycosyltransferase family 87 protein [Vicinamibacterales bacterium]|nr:glycosyltransferase family 87 protein [Vicinamibacterales bacterium]
MRDFEVYWTAASRAASGEPLYRADDGHYQFKYLPAFAVIATPLALLPLQTAKAAWFVASVVLLLILLRLSVAVLPVRRRATWLLTLALIVAMGKFYGHELVLGQVNLLFAVLATAGVLLLRRRRDVAAGLLFVAAMVVKPYAVLFLPWLAWLRRTRAIASAAAGAVVVLVLPSLFYGAGETIGLHQAWWRTVAESTAPNLTNADNVSLAAFFAKWMGIGSAATAAAAACGLVLLIIAALVVHGGRAVADREPLEAALLLTLIPLLSPQGWDYVFLVATPAIAVLANYDDRLPRSLRVAAWGAVLTIGLSLFDLMGRRHYAAFMNWSVITVAFVVVIGALAVLRRRRVA